jgi:hypothetical protein
MPVVFYIGGDPVQVGLVDRLNRPTGNITGVTNFHGLLAAKRLELLRKLVPAASVVAYLINPKNPNSGTHSSGVQAAAHAVDQQIVGFKASSESDVDATSLAQRGGSGNGGQNKELCWNHIASMRTTPSTGPSSRVVVDKSVTGGPTRAVYLFPLRAKE